MAVGISRSLLQRIQAEATASPGREVCGLLFGTTLLIDRVEPTANVAADPTRFFEIAAGPLLHAHRSERGGGPRLIGCYHSHPTGPARPSATDVAMAGANGWLWLIIGADGFGLFRAIDPDGTGTFFQPVALDVLDDTR